MTEINNVDIHTSEPLREKVAFYLFIISLPIYLIFIAFVLWRTTTWLWLVVEPFVLKIIGLSG